MDNGKEQEKQLNDGLKNAMDSISNLSNVFDKALNNLCPQSPPKEITTEVDGIKYKCQAYISMNSILCFDFKDKEEMRRYFDSLK